MKRVNVGDIELSVETRGQRGHHVLLVHGFPLTHSIWRPQIEFLADHCQVIAPDLRGFGLSGVTPKMVSMEQHADDLDALLSALEVREKVVICGLSMGGYVAWEFWRKHSQRVCALILCDTRAVPDTPEAAEGRLKMAAEVLQKGAQAAAEAMLPKMLSDHTRTTQPELLERVRQIMLSNSPEGIAAAQQGMAVRRDARPLLPSIDVPTLVVVGEQDVISRVEEMREIADSLPRSVWLAVPDAGHLAPLENPAVVNQAIAEFLQAL